MNLVNAVATTEGKVVAHDAHDKIRFMYGDDFDSAKTWEINPAEKKETTMGDEKCYYMPVYSVKDEGEEELEMSAVLLLRADTEITAGKRLEYITELKPNKKNLTEALWEEEKHEIKKRRMLLGGAAVGGSTIFATGVVVGVIGIKKWVDKRK